MPSYYRRPYYPTRREILVALRERRRHQRQLAEIFEKTVSRLLPRPKPDLSPGYIHVETTVTLPQPKLSKRRFYQLLYQLKRDGLVQDTKRKGDRLFKITARGLNWLKEITKKPNLTLPAYTQPGEKSDRVTIVSYDIPERMRWHRDWLRVILKNLGLKRLQQSIWAGKIKLPAEFIADLTRYNLVKHVEIFEITKTGTLRHRL